MERVSQLLVTYLINSAWQVPIVCGIAFLSSLILRRTPAQWKHLLWISALLISSLLPLWSLRAIGPELKPEITAPNSQTEIAQTDTLFRATATARPQPRPSWFHVASLSVSARPRLVWMIAASYCIFLLYRVVQLGLAVAHTWNLRALAVDSSSYANLQSIVDRYSSRLRLRASPPVCLTDAVGPLTVGILRPILLMPSTFCQTASETEMHAAVCHELAHVKRHDFLLNLACELVLLPVCYHPLAAVIKARIDRSRELACDDMAADLMAAPAVYARSLVSIAKSISTSSVPKLSCGQGLFDTEAMEERIMNLLGDRPIRANCWARTSAIMSLALVGVVSAVAATFSLQVTPRTAPVISSAGASPHLLSQQSAGGAERPAEETQRARPTMMPQSAEASGTKQISIRSFTLLGGEVAGFSEALSQDLRSGTYDNDISGEIAERVRKLYQERGYFKAIPSAPEIVQAGPSSVDVRISVDPGQQYRLADIRFTGNRVFTKEALRALFPIQTGEVFKPSAILAGLNAMRSLYGSSGLTKVVPMVEMEVDDATRTILINVSADEAHVDPSPGPLASPQPAPEQDLPGYYKVGNGVTAPVAIFMPDPQYDSVARAAKAEGVGVFQIGVGADGTVQKVRAVSGPYPALHPNLVQSAVNTLPAWRFEPALKDGRPVPVQVKVEVNFRLY